MDYDDSVTDAGYQIRFFDNGFDNTIPRKTDKEGKLMGINPFIKTIEADYGANGPVAVDESSIEGKWEAPAVDTDITKRLDDVYKAVSANLDKITDETLIDIFTTKSKSKGKDKKKQFAGADITQLLEYIKTGKKEERQGEGEDNKAGGEVGP